MTNSGLKCIIDTGFNGIIWKLLLDEENDLIAIETRDPDKKFAAFSVINFKTGEVLIKEWTFENSWLYNLILVSHGCLFFSLFAAESKMFQTSGVIVFNIKTQDLEWQNYTVGFWEALEGGMKVYSLSQIPKKFSLLNYKTGQELSDDDSKSLKSSLVLPTSSDDQYAMEALVEGKKVKTFYAEEGGNLKLKLIVKEGNNIILEDILQSDIQKKQRETFFLQLDRLFYIRGNRQLVSYLLQ